MANRRSIIFRHCFAMFGRAPDVQDRRDFARSDVSAPVEVHIPSGVRRGLIVDLSRSGMGVAIDSPPPVGTPALIKWDGQEVMGQVVWEKISTCGIRFDRPLADGLVEETVARTSRTGPPACVLNMQPGQRRSAPWKRTA